MVWTIEFDKRVEKDLRALGPQASRRILTFLRQQIAPLNDPRQIGKPLTGKLRELWRYRVGPYRIIARIEDDDFLVLVARVAHRRKVYR